MSMMPGDPTHRDADFPYPPMEATEPSASLEAGAKALQVSGYKCEAFTDRAARKMAGECILAFLEAIEEPKLGDNPYLIAGWNCCIAALKEKLEAPKK